MKDKVVLITGGSSGIGRATALAFAKLKAKVVIVADKNEEGLKSLTEEIQKLGEQASYIKVDVAKSDEVEKLMAKIVADYGRIDCAFNNAGIEGPQIALHDLSIQDWDHLMSINLKGVWLCLKYEIIQMLKQGSGAIVNMSSVAGIVGMRGYSSYVAAKHGVIGLTKAAALEYATLGIRVNAICPGAIKTPLLDRMIGGNPQVEQWLIAQEPIGRLGLPEEIAKAVVWLCSEEASFMTGHAMVVDGAATVQ